MAKRPELLVISGVMSGRRFSVPDKGLRLGRSSANDISISDEELSRNHCLIECEGDDGLRVMDLASANGTYVNGVALGSEPCSLKTGDVLELGASRLKVVGQSVDLGLNPPPQEESPTEEKTAKKPNLLWLIIAGLCIVLTGVLLVLPTTHFEPVTTELPTEAPSPKLRALSYEKVDADATHIFRYELSVENGILRVVYDDVPIDERHFDKRKTLDSESLERLLKIFEESDWRLLDRAYIGGSASDENALKRYSVCLDDGQEMKEVVVENSLLPDAMKTVCNALEAFAIEKLDIRAIQFSRAQLLAFSAENMRLADAKWADRDAANRNLGEAIDAYKKAIADLETLNPKPSYYAELCERYRKAEQELDRRYKEHRFLVERSLKTGDWNLAERELKIICDLILDVTDERHKEASTKLFEVQNRTQKGGSR